MQNHGRVEREFSDFILMDELGSINRFTKGDEIWVDFLIDWALSKDQQMMIGQDEDWKMFMVLFISNYVFCLRWHDSRDGFLAV